MIAGELDMECEYVKLSALPLREDSFCAQYLYLVPVVSSCSGGTEYKKYAVAEFACSCLERWQLLFIQ